VLGPLPPELSLGVSVTVLRVRVTVTEPGGARFVLDAVVQPGATGGPGAQPRAPTAGRNPVDAPRLAYPVVFLEITEDVGHNQTIAAPGSEVPSEGAGDPGARRSRS
jgi:hypothetical protein